MTGREPTADFTRVALDLITIAPGEKFCRIYRRDFSDPCGFGKSLSRFSDPRTFDPDDRFGVLYLGSSLKVCLIETLIRDERDGLTGMLPMAESHLHERRFAHIEPDRELKMLDLSGDGPLRMGIPSDVARGYEQSLSRKWSVAFYHHPRRIDGIVYPSRLNGEINLAIYDRAVPQLAARSSVELIAADGLTDVLDRFKIALI